MSETKVIPTPAEIEAEGERVRRIFECYTLCLDATIEDYPIGRGDRGKCRLQVERAKGKGYRTVRTTTNRNGAWCKPNKSTYRNGCTAVVTGLGGDRDTRWIAVSEESAYLQAANGDTSVLMRAPHFCKPRREALVYHSVTTRSVNWEGLADAVGSREVHYLQADPVELCDAWDAWYEQYRILRTILLKAWEGHA